MSEIADCIGYEGRSCPSGGNDYPADCRTDAARDVHAHAVEGNGLRQILAGTMSRTDDCQAGLLRAVPQPIRKVKVRSTQGVIRPK